MVEMSYKQDARNFVLKHGIKKSKRIADVNYEFYSESAASYYATDKNNSISIKHLKRAIAEYEEMIEAKINYEEKYLSFIGGL